MVQIITISNSLLKQSLQKDLLAERRMFRGAEGSNLRARLWLSLKKI